MAAPWEGVTEHRARIVWEGGRDDLRAHRVELASQVVPSSCSALWGGDPSKADPEEMFVASLASCHMLWFLSVARERRLRVESYLDEPVGTLDAGRITRVTLHPRVAFRDDPGTDVLEELHDEAHSRCFLAASVNFPVEVAGA